MDLVQTIAWIKSKLAADVEAQLVEKQETFPGGSYRNDQIRFTYDGKSVELSAALVMANPHVAAMELRAGWGIGNANETLANPNAPLPPPAPGLHILPANKPVATPTVLVGSKMDGTEDTDEIYYTVAGDDSPNGTIYEDGRGRFVKRVKRTPFGKSSWWERITIPGN